MSIKETPITLDRMIADWLDTKPEFSRYVAVKDGWVIVHRRADNQDWWLCNIHEDYLSWFPPDYEDIHAADPEFFNKLEESLSIILFILREKKALWEKEEEHHCES